MEPIAEGVLLWEPPQELRSQSELARYMRWLAQRGLGPQTGQASYQALWEWSVADIEGFWRSIWDFFDLRAAQPYERVLGRREMPGAEWFPGARLNYVEQVFRHRDLKTPALIFQREGSPVDEISWAELEEQVAGVAAGLRALGVGPGDRVVGYLPNGPDAVAAFLATASLGAVWSSCSPEFGSQSVADRFSQIEPKVLFAVDSYRYGGKVHDRREAVRALQQALPTLGRTIILNHEANLDGLDRAVHWHEMLVFNEPLRCEQVPFDHPLWVLYSSGTTGLPKPIVQGHGGIVLEHLKALALHHDLRAGDRFFWYTTTGWMMWNFLVGGLLLGCTIMLYDGSPAWPDMGALWEFVAQGRAKVFGASAAYVAASMKAGVEPAERHDLSKLVAFGSTGSPLPPEGFQWLYEHVKHDLWLASISGGTDVCTAFVGGCPLLPVYSGEIQCRMLGARVESFDEQGRPLVDEVGELVVTEPMPSMPLYFWNDPGQARYRESYFEMYTGIWRHGDWVKLTPRGGVVIYGRSDSTINRHGIRIGTSELYRVVEALPEVLDSLAIDLEGLGGKPYMPLFIVLRPGAELDQQLRDTIKAQIRAALSPRHVPDDIFAIAEVPRTLSGKKLEIPVRKILLGAPPERAANPGSLANPRALDFFVQLAQELGAGS